jgi:hypothetical protein
MNQRIVSRTLCLLAAAATFLTSGVSHALAEFPGEIQTHLGMECPPPCNICHATPAGGGTPVTNFYADLNVQGLKPPSPTVAMLLSALDKVEALPAGAMNSDGDGDGTNDVAELRAGRDPSVALTMTRSDALNCPPLYGCGARIAPKQPVDGSALAFALAVAGFMVVRSRRRA